MRREVPDGRGFEPLRVSSDMAALSAPSKRWGAHGGLVLTVASCRCSPSTNCGTKSPGKNARSWF